MRKTPRLGLVREVSILLPLAVLLLVVVSTVTLAAYRSAVDELTRGDIPADRQLALEMARQRAVADRLTWVVIAVDVAVVVFVLLYLRHFVTPFETVLERARGIGMLDRDETDEVEFLVTTFERAIAALAKGSDDEPDEREIAALQRALGSSLGSGVLLMDEAGGVLALNPVGCELLGIAEPGDDRPHVADYCREHPELVTLLQNSLDAREGVSRREVRLVRRDGSTLALGLTTHHLRRDDGTTRGHLALFVDLTEARRRADVERAASTLAQLGRMSAGLAHELRNSVASLRGYLTLIDRHPDHESVHDYLGEIRSESEHLQRVVDDFLSFARPEARFERFPLRTWAEQLARDPALEDVGVTLRLGVDRDLEVRADRHLLERAVRNLVRNAVEASRAAGAREPVELIIDRTDEHLVVRVADRGAGLPDGDPERWFEPFATARAGGIGLGLPLAQRILELHGGHLTLKPRDGGGTEAVALLPIGMIVT